MKKIYLILILMLIFVSGCQLLETHTFRFGLFEDNKFSHYLVDGSVYLNNKYIGETEKGVLSKRVDCNNGKIKFKANFDFNYEKTFEVNCANKIHDFSLATDQKLLTELEVANKLIGFLVPENELIREDAIRLTKDCNVNDVTCKVNSIFTSVTDQVTYVNDPRDIDRLQTIQQTLASKAGDCEDFTVLLSSYLESIGIKTILVLTNNHVYTLACGLDQDDVKNHIPNNSPYFFYNINQEQCYIIDPTIEDSYIGYSSNVLGEKIAVDIKTKEYFILDKQNV